MLHKGNLKGWIIESVSTSYIRALGYLSKFFQITVFLSGFLLVLTITQCKKTTTSGSPTETDVRFVGHKGGGDNSFNAKYIENTLPAVQEGLKTLNGVEIDVQMSLDGTLWMFHNLDIGQSNCNTNYHHSIVLLNDTEIEKIKICNGSVQDKIYRLEELINLWNNTVGGFVISMHVKTDFPADTINKPLIGGEASYLSKFATSLAKLFPTVKHQDQLFVEIYDATFCTKVHTTIPGIKVFLIKSIAFPTLIDDALSTGYDGVSCYLFESTLSVEEVKRARDSGLVVQLWTPDNRDDLLKAFNLKPNIIQTNNLKAISLLNLKVIM